MTVWQDGQAGGTPITAAELNRIEGLIADVPEQARDAIGAALVAGANVTITRDDAANTIAIAAAAGTGAGSAEADRVGAAELRH